MIVDVDDGPVSPEEMQIGKQYIVSYGSRQYTGRGRGDRHITVNRKGDTSECEYYKGDDPQPGMWVTDHTDTSTSRDKFFLNSRYISVRNLTLDELI